MENQLNELDKKFRNIRERVHRRTADMLDYAARFAALNSFIKRHMQPGDAEWCAAWIYEIMDELDYKLRVEEFQDDIFKEVYGVDTFEFRCRYNRYKDGEINELLKPFWRAVNTFGEVKLSVYESMRDRHKQENYDTKVDRINNLKKVKEMKESAIIKTTQ